MKSILLIPIFAICCILCFATGSLLKISEGDEVSPHSKPWQVAVYVDLGNNETKFCGGSLVHEEAVLTTADCVFYALHIQVVLGAHNLFDDEDTQVRINATSWIASGWANATYLTNTIGLILLPKDAVTLDDNIQIIDLASDKSQLYVGTQASISGWGSTSNSTNDISSVLRETQMSVIDNEECKNSFWVDSDQLCADTIDQKTLCGGDGGNPLVVDGVQIGIAADVDSGCLEDGPVAFFRVTEYYDWVQDKILHH